MMFFLCVTDLPPPPPYFSTCHQVLWELKEVLSGPSDSIVSRMFALHTANPFSVPWAPEPGVSPEQSEAQNTK